MKRFFFPSLLALVSSTAFAGAPVAPGTVAPATTTTTTTTAAATPATTTVTTVSTPAPATTAGPVTKKVAWEMAIRGGSVNGKVFVPWYRWNANDLAVVLDTGSTFGAATGLAIINGKIDCAVSGYALSFDPGVFACVPKTEADADNRHIVRKGGGSYKLIDGRLTAIEGRLGCNELALAMAGGMEGYDYQDDGNGNVVIVLEDEERTQVCNSSEFPGILGALSIGRRLDDLVKADTGIWNELGKKVDQSTVDTLTAAMTTLTEATTSLTTTVGQKADSTALETLATKDEVKTVKTEITKKFVGLPQVFVAGGLVYENTLTLGGVGVRAQVGLDMGHVRFGGEATYASLAKESQYAEVGASIGYMPWFDMAPTKENTVSRLGFEIGGGANFLGQGGAKDWITETEIPGVNGHVGLFVDLQHVATNNDEGTEYLYGLQFFTRVGATTGRQYNTENGLELGPEPFTGTFVAGISGIIGGHAQPAKEE